MALVVAPEWLSHPASARLDNSDHRYFALNTLPFVLFLNTLLLAGVMLALIAPSVIAPDLALRHDVDASMIGIQMSLAYLAAAIVSLCTGTLIDKLGPARVFQLSMLSGALGIVLFLPGSLPSAVVGSMLVGAGIGFNTPASTKVLSQYNDHHARNLIFSVKQTGVPIGGAVAGLMLPPIVAFHSVDAALILVCLLCLLCIAAVEPVRATWDRERRETHFTLATLTRGFRFMWKKPELLGVGIMSLMFAAAQLGLMTFTVNFLVFDHGWDLVAAGFAVATVQVAGVAGRIGWGVIADRWMSGKATLALVGLLGAGAFAVLAISDPQWPPLVIMIVISLLGLTAVGWNGVFMGEVSRLSGDFEVGHITGALMVLTYVGIIIAPPLMGLLAWTSGSYALPFWGTGIAMGIGTLAVFLIRSKPMGLRHSSGE